MAYRSSDETEAVLVVAFGGRIFGVSVLDGTTRWEVPDTISTTHRILVRDREVFALGSELVCLDLVTGERRWSAKVPIKIGGHATLHLDGQRIFVARGGQVACFRRSDGAPEWHNAFRGKGLGDVALATERGAVQADHSS